MRARVTWAGNPNATEATNMLVPTGAGYQRVVQTVTVPDGATEMYVRPYFTEGPLSAALQFRNLQVTSLLVPYFDGDTPSTAFDEYLWDGTPGASPSTHKTKRVSPLLYIADEFTNDTEDFTCEVQTKNYNYQLSSNFKRLFWWGVDAVFRTRIRGWAVPVVHHSSVTWGQLRAQGVTWGQLLGGTWGSPFIGDISVYSDYDLGGTGPMRKFVKMFKSMRFRQIYFRLIFDTDGSIGTAPVNLFTITAYVGSKETVSKPVS